MKKLDNILESIAKPFLPITPWLLRLGLGTSFILHGIGKFPLPPCTSPDRCMWKWFESMGYNFPEFVTSAVAIGEVVAGAGVIIGGLITNAPGKYYNENIRRCCCSYNDWSYCNSSF
ncbi:MAG: DoxX family protein [Gammaproteobacteria bacterium]